MDKDVSFPFLQNAFNLYSNQNTHLAVIAFNRKRKQTIREDKMQTSNKTLRTCKNGHQYYKSSDCPTCPVCEKERKPKDSFLSLLAAPARRALENNGITTLQELSAYSEDEILAFHGMGKSSVPKLTEALKSIGLHFKNKAG
jgi:predicted RecB family nuclease